MTAPTLTIFEVSGAIATLTLNDGARMNPLGEGLQRECLEALDRVFTLGDADWAELRKTMVKEKVSVTDSVWRAGGVTPVMPDHGKLAHQFIVRLDSLEVFAHLHPAMPDRATYHGRAGVIPAWASKAPSPTRWRACGGSRPSTRRRPTSGCGHGSRASRKRS